jgi:hypothetical protein
LVLVCEVRREPAGAGVGACRGDVAVEADPVGVSACAAFAVRDGPAGAVYRLCRGWPGRPGRVA